MNTLKKKFGPLWAPTLAICLTIVACTAVTATAATIINGKNIKKKSISGTALKNNTITGTQVKESKLGRVPLATRADLANQADNASNAANAAKVGGIDPSAFTRGGGTRYTAAVNGSAGTNNVTVLNVPGLFVLRFDCDANGVANTPEVLNQSGGSMYILGTGQGAGSGAATESVVEPNSTGWNDNIYVSMQTRSVGNGTFQAWNVNTGKVVTVTYSSIFCSYSAEATVS